MQRTTDFNFDTMLARLHERQTEESDLDTLCDNCQATLTAVDRHAGYRTQCKSSIESDNEDLNDFNGWEAGL